MEIIWVMLAMWLAAVAPDWLFPDPEDAPTPRELMSNGNFAEGFKQWSRQCGWYLLILTGFGAYMPEQRELGLVFLSMLAIMWLGWAALCKSGMAPKQ